VRLVEAAVGCPEELYDVIDTAVLVDVLEETGRVMAMTEGRVEVAIEVRDVLNSTLQRLVS
jgi:hypothetical protein